MLKNEELDTIKKLVQCLTSKMVMGSDKTKDKALDESLLLLLNKLGDNFLSHNLSFKTTKCPTLLIAFFPKPSSLPQKLPGLCVNHHITDRTRSFICSLMTCVVLFGMYLNVYQTNSLCRIYGSYDILLFTL